MFVVLFTLMLPLLVTMLGLGIDVAHYWWVRGHLSNAADAAALAGSKELNATAEARTRATTFAATFAQQHKVDGAPVAADEVVENVTGRWDFDTGAFTATNVSDPMANAIRVTVQRAAVPSFFAHATAGMIDSPTLSASAVAVAGGARAVGCAAPVAVASCILEYGDEDELVCPTKLSFQNGLKSVGLTHPDGSSPVSGTRAEPYFEAALEDPDGCTQGAAVGDTLYLQNGNDLTQDTADAINEATDDGNEPISLVVPVIDMSCGNSGPNYNQSAVIAGFMRLKVVGARWTGAAPAKVAAACPGLGKKNICVTEDCSMIDAPGGGTIQTSGVKTYLVR
jgi:Flp pilus assembly protein TadG